MKRALAERAKQEADEDPFSVTAPPASAAAGSVKEGHSPSPLSGETNNAITKTNAPPLKIPKLEHTSAVTSLSSNHRSTSLPNLSQSNKRMASIRMPSHKEDDDEEDSNNAQNAFYLKHQNKALASELHQYKHTILLLEQERHVRRQELEIVSNVIQEWNQIWTGVEGSLMKLLHQKYPMERMKQEPIIKTTIPQDTPSSTGTGTNLEKIHDIIASMVQLSNGSFSIVHDHDTKDQHHMDHHNEDEENAITYIQALSNTTQQFSKRCIQFQELIQQYLLLASTMTNTHTGDSTIMETTQSTTDDTITKCYTQISKLQHTCSALQGQLDDMAKAKDEANESERRVRRGLYRLASGRLNIAQVLQAVEKDGSSTLEDLNDIQGDILSATTDASTLDNAQIKAGQEGQQEGCGSADAIVLDGKVVSSSDVMLMKKKMDDLELVNLDREKRIQELLNEKEGHEKKLNELLSQQKTSTSSTFDVTTSPQYAELSTKLAAAEKEIENFKIDLKSVQDRWAVTKGDLELARKSVSELEIKHRRRLRELLGVSGDDTGTEEDGEEDTVKEAYFDQGKTVMELEHKLKHALDNVRQAETIRNMLRDAHALNEMLKREIIDLKTRNEELSASKTDDNSLSSDNIDLNDKESRKLRKELEAAISSKAQARDRLEQALKERDALLDMNQRLQQQCVEKDDMNAKSLSSILHLKQLSEQLEQEKVKMEISLKSAQQLALTARLAANAKIRVEEEATKEKEIAEAEMNRVKDALEALQTEKNAVDAEVAAYKAKIEESKAEASAIRKRCDDLVSAGNASEIERKQLEEALVIAKKDAAEAVKKAAVAQANARGESGDKFDTEFTKEELTILVNDLKSRLACPVCNTREKKVINTRCRHMFCRQCVDKSLENRNRKCPSCGIRFDKKDIEDVWF